MEAQTYCNGIDVATYCLAEDCGADQSCPSTHSCGGGKSAGRDVGDASATPFSCRILCNGAPADCVSPGGTADPHMTAFDGSSFSFQGVGGRHYVLFGHPRGDVLTTRMRATERQQPGTNATGTFFDAFGIRTASGRRVRVVLAKDVIGLKGRLYRPVVSVDGAVIYSKGKFDGLNVSMGKNGESVEIATTRTRFKIQAAGLNDDDGRHMNMGIKLIGRPEMTQDYMGVLGFTLNKVNGRKIDADLCVADRSVHDLELAMRRRFGVNSLFPDLDERALLMRGVVRFVVPDSAPQLPEGLSAHTG